MRASCAKLGIEVVEHDYSGEVDCCGYGGLMQFANKELGKKAVQHKARRSELDGLAYCAMCRDNLALAKPLSSKIWQNDLVAFKAVYEVVNNAYAIINAGVE